MSQPPVDLMGIKAEATKSSFVNFSASAGATRKLGDNMSLGFTFGRGVRSPSMIERFIISLPVGTDNYEYIGNPNLLPEANNEFDLLYKYQHTDLGGFELTGFYSIIQDYIGGVYLPLSEQRPLMSNVLGVKRFANLGTAKIKGFEFSYATPSRYKLNIKLTASMTSGTIDTVEVLEVDPATGNVTGSHLVQNDPLGEIPPMEANLNISYNILNNKLKPSFTLRYVAAQNNISTAMQELSSESFTLLGFRLVYQHNNNLTVVGGVNNMLDKAYYEHLNRRVLGTDSRIYEPGRSFYINLILDI